MSWSGVLLLGRKASDKDHATIRVEDDGFKARTQSQDQPKALLFRYRLEDEVHASASLDVCTVVTYLAGPC
eukprot:jgi/Chlat1/708/Chrsp104S01298